MVSTFIEADADDLPRLEAWQPTGKSATHAARLGRAESGGSTYLIAVDESGAFVASCEIRWSGNAADEIDDGVPEVNGLQVWPEHLRGHGYGSELLDHVESLARARGHSAIGLGVADANTAAARLYHRRGYVGTGRRYRDRYAMTDDDGTRHEFADECAWLVKPLV